MGFMQAPAAGGDFNTFLKYDARSGRWHTKPDGGGDLYEVENMTAIFDLENIRTGWFQFFEGAAPVKVFDQSLTEATARPNPDAKKGFEVLVYSEANIGGLREFTSTAATVIEAMNALYDDWEANRAANPGKLPVVKCVGVQSVKTAKSTNYRPALEIVTWAPRPEGLPVPEGTPPAANAKPAASVRQAAPPPPATAKADEPVF